MMANSIVLPNYFAGQLTFDTKAIVRNYRAHKNNLYIMTYSPIYFSAGIFFFLYASTVFKFYLNKREIKCVVLFFSSAIKLSVNS